MIGFRLSMIQAAPMAVKVLRLAIASGGDPGMTDYTVSSSGAVRQNSFTGATMANVLGVDISKDGKYAAYAIQSSPFVVFYKRTGSTWTRLPAPARLPAGSGTSVAISYDSQYVVVGHYTAPFMTLYKRSGDTFTAMDVTFDALNNRVAGVSFHPKMNQFAIALIAGPFAAGFNITNDVLTRLPDPNPAPAYFCYGARFSPNGDLVGFASSQTPYYFIYKWSSAGFGAALAAGTPAEGGGRSIAFGPNSDFFAMSTTTSPYLAVYKLTGNAVGAKLTVPSGIPSNGIGVDISPKGDIIAVAHTLAPFLTLFTKTGDSIVMGPAVDQNPTNNGNGAQFYY